MENSVSPRVFITVLLALNLSLPGGLRAESGPLIQPASVESGQSLCALGDRVIALPEVDCKNRQDQERQSASALNATLDQLAFEVGSPSLKLDLLEGLTLGVRYLLQVQPSYRDQFFTRIDRYTLETDVRPGDSFPGLPVALAIDSGTEILFAQQFVSGAEARNPGNTYLPHRLPLNSKKALALKPGDYVRFDAHMNLLARLGQLFDIPQGFMNVGASISGVLSGNFQVHVFRLGQNEIRLKLIMERNRSGKVAAQVSPDLPLGILAIDARAQRILELKKFDRSLSAALSRANQSVFLIDYTLDLSNPDVRDAYDKVFGNGLAMGAAAVARVRSSHNDLRHELLGSVVELDSLQVTASGDDNYSPVIRNFKGAASAYSQQLDFRVALRSYAVERRRIYREKLLSRVSVNDEGLDDTHYFLLPSWTRTRQRAALFGHLQEASLQTADAIFSADALGNPQKFQNIGFRYFYEDSVLRPTEYGRIREKIELLLPPAGQQALAERLKDTAWLNEDSHRNVQLSLDYFFRESALRGLEAQGLGKKARLKSEILEFVVRSLEANEFLYFNGDLQAFIDRYRGEVAPRGQARKDLRLHARQIADVLWSKQIQTVVRHLSVALDTRASNVRRLEAFKSLRFSAFYRAISGGLWVHLVNQAELDLESALYIELSLSGTDRESVRFTYGDDSERALYQAVQLIDAILNDRGADMREPGELENIVTRLSLAGAPQ